MKIIKFLIIILVVVVLLLAFRIIFYWKFPEKKSVFSFSPIVKYEIAQEQIEDIISLKPNQVIFGEVVSKQDDQIVLKVVLFNPIERKIEKNISVNIPIKPQDEIFRFKKVADTSELKTIKVSFENIKIGDYLAIKIFQDKKILYLPIQ